MQDIFAMIVIIIPVKYVINNDEKGLAFSGIDFEHILYNTFDNTIIIMENTYINII
jgi:hypothetical protein